MFHVEQVGDLQGLEMRNDFALFLLLNCSMWNKAGVVSVKSSGKGIKMFHVEHYGWVGLVIGIIQDLKCSMWNKMEIGDSNLPRKFHVERLNVNVLIRKLYLVTFAR